MSRPTGPHPRGPAEVYVGLGSNLGDRVARLREALRALGALPKTELVAVSPLYETSPVGGPPQGAFLNAVAQLLTELPPRRLLQELLALEVRAGRVRGAERNAPRPLDLDLLLYGDLRLEEPGLVVPHPRLAERAFVLEPLCELAPELVHPSLGEPIAGLAARCRDPAAVRLWREEEGAWRSSP